MDGTLTNSQEGIYNCLYYAFDSMNVKRPPESEMQKFIGPPLLDSFREIMGFDEKQSLTALEKYRERYTTKGLYENYPYEGMEELLREVGQSGKILAVSTSKPEFMSVRVLEYFGLAKYFETIAGSDNESEGKREVIEKTISRLNIPRAGRDEILMVGDRKYDIIGAHSCDVKACGVGYGFASGSELRDCSSDYIAETVSDLKRLLLEI